MTDKLFYQIWGDAHQVSEADAFASDWVQSTAFLDPEDPDQEIDMELFQQLRTLWEVAHIPFRELLERMGLRQTACSTRFCIPLRTVQGWALGERECPPYVRLMMAEAVGLVRLRAWRERTSS